MKHFPRRTTQDRMAEAAYYRNLTETATKRREEQDAMKKEIPTVSLKYCEYDKTRKVLKLASEYFGMPKEFFVKSHHTGKEVRFVVVGSEDRLFDQDQWDGEQQVYRPMGNVPGVDHLVIYHQY